MKRRRWHPTTCGRLAVALLDAGGVLIMRHPHYPIRLLCRAYMLIQDTGVAGRAPIRRGVHTCEQHRVHGMRLRTLPVAGAVSTSCPRSARR